MLRIQRCVLRIGVLAELAASLDRRRWRIEGTDRFFKPNYIGNLVDAWLPALDGVVAKLQSGGTVTDIGCGHGASTILIAEAYPKATLLGTDPHPPSIEAACKAASQAGVADRYRFEVTSAKDFPGNGYDLVTSFDCLRDMGDPVGASAHVRETLADDGTWLIVEPNAGDRLEGNLNPVGRIFYSASTMICVPGSRSQEVGLAPGAQAGEARIREVTEQGGFTRFRSTSTPRTGCMPGWRTASAPARTPAWADSPRTTSRSTPPG